MRSFSPPNLEEASVGIDSSQGSQQNCMIICNESKIMLFRKYLCLRLANICRFLQLSSKAEEISECEMSCCSKFTKYLNAIILEK